MAAGRAAAEGEGPAAKVANKVAESPKAAPAKRRAARAPVKRDAAATRQRILDAARRAFCDHGYEGARVDRIAAAARANVQMIYRYYGGKEDLYLAVLEDTYASIRTLERELDLAALAPVEGMRRLVEFTFDYLRDNPDFAAIIRNENMMGGRFVRKLAMVPDTTTPLMAALSDLLDRGHAEGVFRPKIDPPELYVTILSLCIIHMAQRHTLSVMFQRDLGAEEWLGAWRARAVDVVLTYLTAPRG